MKSFKKEYKVKAPISKVWDALTNSRTISKWGAGPAKMKPLVGFKFSLWGGDIHGVNTKITQGKEIVQDWMAGTWDEYSKVTFKLSEKSGVTKITLIQKRIPDKEYRDIVEGWDRYYITEIKKLLEVKD